MEKRTSMSAAAPGPRFVEGGEEASTLRLMRRRPLRSVPVTGPRRIDAGRQRSAATDGDDARLRPGLATVGPVAQQPFAGFAAFPGMLDAHPELVTFRHDSGGRELGSNRGACETHNAAGFRSTRWHHHQVIVPEEGMGAPRPGWQDAVVIGADDQVSAAREPEIVGPGEAGLRTRHQ